MKDLTSLLGRSGALLGVICGLVVLPACGDESNDGPTGGSGGSGGGSGGDDNKAGSSSAGSDSKAGTSSGGKGNAGSAHGGSSVAGGGLDDGAWQDVSPAEADGNVSAVAVNRLTGELLADVTDLGVFKSTNGGADWEDVDGGTVTGLVVLGPGIDVDQDNPQRVAVWSLDGLAAWTPDFGETWNPMTSVGRNWDFGSTDWASPDPKTMIVTRHEANGEVYVSTNAGGSWDLLSIKVFASGVSFPPPEFAMVGVMDSTTLIYSEGMGGGILRSTDTGQTFEKVSDFDVRTRVPVLFNGVFYLGGDGLVVSKDKGATWEAQGSSLEIWVGPYFGADENHIMVANNEGVYLTEDGGTNWSRAIALPSDPQYDPQIFGGFGWDPTANVVYAAALGKPLLKAQL